MCQHIIKLFLSGFSGQVKGILLYNYSFHQGARPLITR